MNFDELPQYIHDLDLTCLKSELRQHMLSAQATYLTSVSPIVVWMLWIVFPGLPS